MRNKCLIFALLLYSVSANAKLIVIDFSFPDYKFNKQTFTSKQGNIFLINCLRTDYLSPEGNKTLRPLLVFQIFDFKSKPTTEPEKNELSSFANYLEQVQDELLRDMTINVSDLMRSTNLKFTYIIFDSLVIKESDAYTLYTGVIRMDFFNVLPYEQLHPLQCNQTILNVKAIIVPVHSWVQDSIPVFKANYLDKKIFLFKKKNSNYSYYVIPTRDEHDPLAFITGYVYRDNYGVVGMKTRYLCWTKDYGGARRLKSLEYVKVGE